MEFDLHSRVQAIPAFTNVQIASNTTTNGLVIDSGPHVAGSSPGGANAPASSGSNGLEYVIQTGTVTDGTYTVSLQESDTGAFAGEETAVVADEILGALPAIEATDDDKCFRVGSIGKKRFQRMRITSAGVTTGARISAVAVLSHVREAAVPDQSL